ncbi:MULTISPECIES: enoyl-CoA hydratase/isomerase family protein [Roseobacteraceae]|uniref:2,3-dehydroadipyl-CoA hydratase n=1 Tax=Pseudosulfitobacter pseudonitzschiae TaxID=1402135 RepID=A0A221K554_9RHOB|nr:MULTISPECIES: enoyl-CoA hydratase-related protein [Roseobacteraceae]ASM74138.1 2,3-dehydroadipyl-CoA hydratase [Pseudosulfitobacter pseudonitzschiae]
MNDVVRTEVEGAVTTLTVDSPEYRNSMGAPGVREGLAAAIDAFEADDTQRVLVLTGANGTFSAGGNLKVLKGLRSRPELEDRITKGGGTIGTILRSDKLYIAAVEGSAFGAGVGLAAACDLVVAADGARFCAAQIRVGASPDGGMFWSVPRRMGRAAAKRLLLTGDEINQAAALAQGLADYPAPDGGALEAAQKLGRKLAYGPPLAQTTVKRFFAQDITGMDAVLGWERDTAIDNFMTDDFAEGASAFLEKRRPTFRGE